MVRRRPTSRTLAVLLAIGYWLAVAAMTWLDRPIVAGAHHAAVFSFIITALSWVASGLAVVESAVVVTLEALVHWLSVSMVWVIRRIANIATSTGSIFSKAWEGIKKINFGSIKRMLVWLDDGLKRFETWLRKTFEPLFKFIRAVRDQVNAIYTRFFRPVLDAIDVIRQTNRVLNTFHIHLLDKLDELLGTLEHYVQAPFDWLYAQINNIGNWLNIIVTADGLFQRLTLLRSLVRDVGYQWRILINAGVRDMTIEQRNQLHYATTPRDPKETVFQAVRYLAGEHTDVGAAIAAAVNKGLAILPAPR